MFQILTFHFVNNTYNMVLAILILSIYLLSSLDVIHDIIFVYCSIFRHMEIINMSGKIFLNYKKSQILIFCTVKNWSSDRERVQI